MNIKSKSLLNLLTITSISILATNSFVNAATFHNTEGEFEFMVEGLPQTYTGSYFFEEIDGAGEVTFSGILSAGLDTFEIRNGQKSIIGFDLPNDTLYEVTFDFVQISPPPDPQEIVQSVTLSVIRNENQLTDIFPQDVIILGIGPVSIKAASATWIPVPEPSSTLSLLSLGILGVGATLKRKVKRTDSVEKEPTKVG